MCIPANPFVEGGEEFGFDWAGRICEDCTRSGNVIAQGVMNCCPEQVFFVRKVQIEPLPRDPGCSRYIIHGGFAIAETHKDRPRRIEDSYSAEGIRANLFDIVIALLNCCLHNMDNV